VVGIRCIQRGYKLTIHLTARLSWHDRGWDGCICDDPTANVYCVVHDHIRDSRNDEEEIKCAKQPLSEIVYRPPCCRDLAVYSNKGYTILHQDPLEWRRLPSTDEDIPPYTAVTSPYGHMFSDNSTWEYNPEIQIQRLKPFFNALTPKVSLIFYYLKDGQPFIETNERIVVGIGRIEKIGPQMYFGGPGNEKGIPYPVWPRSIVQNYPAEGFRLPLQEYVKNGFDATNIICMVPDSLRENFSYVAEHISDDAAVTIIERLIYSVRMVISENKIVGGWQQHLAWLETVLSEIWQNRGPYPGIGAVLLYLGCHSGLTFQKEMLKTNSDRKESLWEFTESILEGRRSACFPGHTKDLLEASRIWNNESVVRRKLLQLLARFEISSEQVERIMHPTKRQDSGLPIDENEIIDNPYLLSELDLGDKELNIIDFNTIDHGVMPPATIADASMDIVRNDDERRVRALLIDNLRHAAQQGNTIMSLEEVCRSIEHQLKEGRKCLPDPNRIKASKDFFEEHLQFIDTKAGQLVQLRTLAEDEATIRERLCKMIRKSYEGEDISWADFIDEVLEAKEQPSADECNARKEKVAALKCAFGSRFCVITGKAGTGKTTIAGALLNGIESIEGKLSPLLFTPTGKARIRLQERTRREAKTIHQFLSENGWIDFKHGYILKRQGGTKKGASTVLIDECSMIPVDLMAALFRAIDWNDVRRLILVGDPNQLPPIGPGRPFADVIAWMDEDEQRRQRLVRLQYRGRFEDANSLALQLSDGYSLGESIPSDDEILAKVAIGDTSNSDVEVYYWKDAEELNRILRSSLYRLVLNNANEGDFRAIDESFKNSDDGIMPESWQIISPLRRQFFGTEELNRLIQLEFRKSMIEKSRNREFIGQGHQLPKPAGEQQIVWKDKVIHTHNEYRRSWVPGDDKDHERYVANGEVGIVIWAERKNKKDQLSVIFGTQPTIRFKYFTSEVNERLELAYALTVHKSQGSDFKTVFLILPKSASTLSRELVYTGLTRFKKKMVIFLEQDIGVLEHFRKPSTSETLLRNTNLFALAMSPESVGFPHPENLIHRTSTNILVRSKSEVIVADTLTRFGISYKYEDPLFATDNTNDFRLPDFTIKYEGETWYWEHLGMLSVPSYANAWERKRMWYAANGYANRVITSEDGPNGSINVPEIEKTIRRVILS